MIIKFYKNNSQNIELTKTLTNEFEINGHLNSECDLVNPVITIGFDGNIVNYNYVYIPAFNRYYFINKITLLGKTIEIGLHCDVISSFKDDILSSAASIVRTKQGNNYIADNLVLETSKVKRQCQKIGNGFVKSEKFVLQLGG